MSGRSSTLSRTGRRPASRASPRLNQNRGSVNAITGSTPLTDPSDPARRVAWQRPHGDRKRKSDRRAPVVQPRPRPNVARTTEKPFTPAAGPPVVSSARVPPPLGAVGPRIPPRDAAREKCCRPLRKVKDAENTPTDGCYPQQPHRHYFFVSEKAQCAPHPQDRDARQQGPFETPTGTGCRARYGERWLGLKLACRLMM